MICAPDFFSLDERSQFLVSARNEVQKVLASSCQPTKVSLFLAEHYPFFSKKVQTVLRERHPRSPSKAPVGYAVDAYLWAEQYGWLAYENSPINSPVLFEEFASFYFTFDLGWYSRLLSAIVETIDAMLLDAKDGPREIVFQSWYNRFTGEGKTPSRWLEGMKALEDAKKMVRQSGSTKDPRNSWRVSVARINQRRRAIFDFWRTGWQAELELLDQMLGTTSG